MDRGMCVRLLLLLLLYLIRYRLAEPLGPQPRLRAVYAVYT